jgi:hypothetical protein
MGEQLRPLFVILKPELQAMQALSEAHTAQRETLQLGMQAVLPLLMLKNIWQL